MIRTGPKQNHIIVGKVLVEKTKIYLSALWSWQFVTACNERSCLPRTLYRKTSALHSWLQAHDHWILHLHPYGFSLWKILSYDYHMMNHYIILHIPPLACIRNHSYFIFLLWGLVALQMRCSFPPKGTLVFSGCLVIVMSTAASMVRGRGIYNSAWLKHKHRFANLMRTVWITLANKMLITNRSISIIRLSHYVITSPSTISTYYYCMSCIICLLLTKVLRLKYPTNSLCCAKLDSFTNNWITKQWIPTA